MIEIHLPWPDKRLSPNSHKGWRSKATAAKEANSIGYWETYKVWDTEAEPAERYMSRYTFYPPDKRRRDIDNFLSMEKHYQDGVFACIGIDDSAIKETSITWGEVVRGGKVTLQLEEMDEDNKV